MGIQQFFSANHPNFFLITIRSGYFPLILEVFSTDLFFHAMEKADGCFEVSMLLFLRDFQTLDCSFYTSKKNAFLSLFCAYFLLVCWVFMVISLIISLEFIVLLACFAPCHFASFDDGLILP